MVFKNKPYTNKGIISVTKDWSDDKASSEHPDVKIALVKDGQIIEVKTLSNTETTVEFKNIDINNIRKYEIYELDDNDKKIEDGKIGVIKGRKFEANYIPIQKLRLNSGTIWIAEVINTEWKDIKVTKEWKYSRGQELKNHQYTSEITASMPDAKKAQFDYNEKKTFTSSVHTNYYSTYAEAVEKFSILFQEKGDDGKLVDLEAGKGKEIAIGGKTFIATITKNAINDYTIVNKEKAKSPKPEEEKVTLKVKKTWDGKELQNHPETYFALFKNGKLLPNTVKKLGKSDSEVTWTNIAKKDYKKYLPRETDKDGKPAKKHIKLDGKTYEVVPRTLEWVDEKNGTYSYTINNALKRVIIIDKEWQGKDGKTLKDDSLKSNIAIWAEDDNGGQIREDHDFDSETASNTYYISSKFTKLSFEEDGIALTVNKGAEVKIGNRTFIATLKEISKEHYEVTNREKSDKPVKPNSTKVKFSKRDIAGKELKDATIRLTHADGTSEEWKSDGTVKEFTVKEGKYTFKETAGSGWIPGIYRNYI